MTYVAPVSGSGASITRTAAGSSGSAALKTALVASGLPASPPVSDGGSSFPSAWTGAAAFVVLLLLLALRRRGTTRLPAPRSTA